MTKSSKRNRHRLIASLLLSTTLIGFTAMAAPVFQNNVVNAATKKGSAPKTKNGTVTAKPSSSSSTAPGNSSSSSAKLAGSKTITGTKTISNDTITATKANESGVYVKNGGKLILNDSTINKTGKTTSDDNSNFYGQNAGLVVTKGGSATVNNLTETTDADGANAIFATGSGATVKVNNATIKTSQNSSRGLDATQTGKIIATNTNITTKGSHSATMANDRGGGTVSLTKGNLKTSGDGSPILYSTGKLIAKDVQGKASGAEAAVIEGANSINVTNSHLTAGKNNGVMLYQSMSGDAEEGTASFTMKGGSLTSKVKASSKGTTNRTGALFYVTNTNAQVNLNNVKLSNASDTLIRLAGDRWGTSGKNGGKLTLTATKQTLNGNVEVAKGSSLNLSLKNGSQLTGSINNADTTGTTKLTLDSNSTWTVTKDSYLTALISSKTSIKNIKSNGHTVYYDKSNSANSWLNGQTYKLSGGGKLVAK